MNVTRKGKKLDDEMTKGMGKAKMEAREHASNAKGNRGEEIACPDVTSLRGTEARAGSEQIMDMIMERQKPPSLRST